MESFCSPTRRRNKNFLEYEQILVFDEIVFDKEFVGKKTFCQKLGEDFCTEQYRKCHKRQKKYKYVVNRHMVFPCLKQIYFVKDLHVHKHYSIPFKNLSKFLEDSQTSNYLKEIYFYSSHMSYMNDFIVVINHNTTMWSKNISLLHDNLNLPSLVHILTQHKSKIDPKRNTVQQSFGYSSQSYTTYKETSLPKPRLLKGSQNSQIVNAMENLSDMLKFLKKENILDANIFNNALRNNKFSQSISFKNIFEGITLCLQSSSESLGSHIDQNNCKDNKYNGVLGVSLIKGRDRIVILGYGKNVARCYMNKLESNKNDIDL